MQLRWLEVDNYKSFERRCHLEVRPITILVGRNNAGKSALARAIAVVAGAFASTAEGVPALPLESFELVHGTSINDLITGRSLHGQLALSMGFSAGDDEVRIDSTIQSVAPSPGQDPRPVISMWRIEKGSSLLELERSSLELDDPTYHVVDERGQEAQQSISFHRFFPRLSESRPPDWITETEASLRSWAAGVRYLKSPRHLVAAPFRPLADPHSDLGADGRRAPQALAASDLLMSTTQSWFEEALDVSLELKQQGEYYSLGLRGQRSSPVALEQAGQGIAQVLPVTVLAHTRRFLGDGIDVIEHPEAELHPAAHAQVAQMLLESVEASDRPLIVETHSEMLLLRLRRWLADASLSLQPGDVSLNWIESLEDGTSTLRRIEVDEKGELDDWPEGVFSEEYEEILAIRRAARVRGGA